MIDIFKDIDTHHAEHIVKYLKVVNDTSTDTNFNTFVSNVSKALDEHKIFQLKKEVCYLLTAINSSVKPKDIQGYLSSLSKLTSHTKYNSNERSSASYPLNLFRPYFKGKLAVDVFVVLMYDEESKSLWSLLFDFDNLVTMVAKDSTVTMHIATSDPFEKLRELVKVVR